MPGSIWAVWRWEGSPGLCRSPPWPGGIKLPAGKRPYGSAASAASCSLALCLVVFYLGHLADRRDWSALLDTAGAFRLCAGGLFLGTLLLNALALAGYPWRRGGAGAHETA